MCKLLPPFSTVIIINGLTSCQQCHCKMKAYHVSHPSTPTLPAQTPSPEICGALEKPMPCSVWMSWCSGTSSAGRIVRKVNMDILVEGEKFKA
ncbi:hypothetical protein D5086_018183 [Populus alba]|uniref:Uncharacterized protein n=1 Tax=Populus alba TaxID=43335 RepID=A0ACC4BNY5_POPAL